MPSARTARAAGRSTGRTLRQPTLQPFSVLFLMVCCSGFLLPFPPTAATAPAFDLNYFPHHITVEVTNPTPRNVSGLPVRARVNSLLVSWGDVVATETGVNVFCYDSVGRALDFDTETFQEPYASFLSIWLRPIEVRGEGGRGIACVVLIFALHTSPA